MAKNSSVSQEVRDQISQAHENGDNRTITVVQKTVKVTAMSVREKERIEKLIDSRRQNLTTYLEEMRSFADEANEHVPFSNQDRLNELAREKAQLNLKKEKISGASEAEFQAVKRFLDEEQIRKINRLDNIKERLILKYREEIDVARETIDKKFAKKLAAFVDEQAKIEAEEKALYSQASAEKLMRKISLQTSFNDLRDQVGDARNSACENLWTGTQLPEDASKVLAQLPDASVFRRNVTPQHMFRLFEATVSAKGLPASDIVACYKCKGQDLKFNGGTSYYCKGCGAHGDIDSRPFKGALPSLSEIVSRQIEVPAIAHTVVEDVVTLESVQEVTQEA
jgi:hypothetical protein